MTVTPLVSETDLAWLCGVLEGEGSFDAHRGKYPRIRIGMTDRDVVGRAAMLMGASVRLSLRKAPAKPIWNTEVQGPRAAAIMQMVLPYMGARRSARIAEVLSAATFVAPENADRKSAPGPSVTRPHGILAA